MKSIFGIFSRLGGNKGHISIVPTEMRYVEADGSDVRVGRAREYDENGRLIKTYLVDQMGTPFGDLEDVHDDPSYLHGKERE